MQLIGNYDHNDQQAIRRAVKQIQQQFDLDSGLIQRWLDREDFEQAVLELDRKCYRQVMEKGNPILDKLLNVSHTESFVNDSLFWAKESCGAVLEESGNGYIKYCNKHKYLHDNNHEHQFVMKSPTDILEEQIFKTKFNMYLQIVRDLSVELENEFYKWIESISYNEYFVQIEEVNPIVEWLKANPNSFKAKFPVYQSDLDEISREKHHKRKRTLRGLRSTIQNIKGKKKKKAEQEAEDPLDVDQGQTYIKIYVADGDKLPELKSEIISRSML